MTYTGISGSVKGSAKWTFDLRDCPKSGHESARKHRIARLCPDSNANPRGIESYSCNYKSSEIGMVSELFAYRIKLVASVQHKEFIAMSTALL